MEKETTKNKTSNINDICNGFRETTNGRNKYISNDENGYINNCLPEIVKQAVLGKSGEMPEDSLTVEGYDFNEGLDYEKLLGSFKRTGFQALHLAQAVDEINRMLDCRDQPLENGNIDIEEVLKPKSNCTIFLGYTSNMVSAGIRDIIRFLVQHRLVDVLVTTAGGIEEDFMKCMAPTYIGSFNLDGATLRNQGLNRTGNLIVPNNNYTSFEEWFSTDTLTNA